MENPCVHLIGHILKPPPIHADFEVEDFDGIMGGSRTYAVALGRGRRISVNLLIASVFSGRPGLNAQMRAVGRWALAEGLRVDVFDGEDSRPFTKADGRR